MTLDDAIKHCEEKAKELRKEADLFSNSPAYSESTTAGCLECAKEHEQLAEWLKELKAYKEASKGDLISREALLKAMEEERQYLLARGQTGAEHILVHHCFPIIDNAPTVDAIPNAEGYEMYNKGYVQGYERGKAEARPQGEWYYNYQNGWHCSLCHETVKDMPTVMGKAVFNFCPNCGADMRKGGAE